MKLIRLNVSEDYLTRVIGYTGVRLLNISISKEFGYIDIMLERVEDPLFYSVTEGDIVPIIEKVSLRD